VRKRTIEKKWAPIAGAHFFSLVKWQLSEQISPLRPYRCVLLTVVVADVYCGTRSTIELYFYFHRGTICDRLSITAKVFQFRSGDDGVAETPVANRKVEHSIRANRLGCDTLK
jgi:hypothetical protein